MLVRVVLSFAAIGSAATANAGICNYRPSQAISAAAVAGAAATTAAAGATASAAGVYTLVHATTGLTMVGGTWAGASAAGTAGIIAGTAGTLGTVVAVVTAPATIIAGTAAAAGLAGLEGACYFTDTRITDLKEVDAIVKNIAVTAKTSDYRYTPRLGQRPAFITVRDPNSKIPKFSRYNVRDLYIVNGALKHRRAWALNETIGLVGTIRSSAKKRSTERP